MNVKQNVMFIILIIGMVVIRYVIGESTGRNHESFGRGYLPG
ncbi:MAG: hypothetical protein ACE5GL_03050 [Calditrichia bacterium]